MHLKVQSVEVVRESKKFDGSVIKNAKALVGDEFGCVVFWAKNEQVDLVKEGAVVTFRNAHANVFQEHLRLEVDRWAKLELSNQRVDSVKTSNNLSDVEYELVAVKK